MKSVTVLGSTGSVGRQTLDIIAHHPEKFSVRALAAGRNVEMLAEQAKAFRPEFIAIGDENLVPQLKDRLSGLDVKIGGGPHAVNDAAAMACDMTMAAIVGTAGLVPTMTAIAQGRSVAFASKECLVAAGPIMLDAVRRHGTIFLPVDSEHNAIFQVLQDRAGIRRIVLTASGGPFRDLPAEKFGTVTPEQAVAHPTWSMGQKISVDSATLMNKALEVIEAHHLFNLPSGQIDVVIHPQSTVHGMVEYADGSFLAQMGPADMRTPIAVCLGWPSRIDTPGARMDLGALSRLDFAPVDTVKFRSMALVREVLAAGASDSIVFNAANEVAVAAFLKKSITFAGITDTVAEMLAVCHKPAINSLDDVLACDNNVRVQTLNYLKKVA